MPVSHITKAICPECGKVFIEKSRFGFGEISYITGECGHIVTSDKLKVTDRFDEFVSTDGMTLMPFQKEGIQFVEAAGGIALIADEQGLGKTVQDLGFLAFHPECFPVVHVTKSALKNQGYHEIQRWLSKILGRKLYIQVISSGKERPLPGFDFYIISYDMLKNEEMFSDIEFNTIVFDECQAIKNHTSGRGQAAADIAKRAKYKLGLSGTPIKNNAGEYFTILNILHPERFPEYTRYIKTYCDSYETQYGYKVGGLQDVDHFREATSDFIIRRTQAEVLPDLPKMSRRFHHVELNPKFNSAYRDALKELDNLLYGDDEAEMTAIIAIMTKMRRITGLSKTFECIEFVQDFLQSTDRPIVVFVHHHAVATQLNLKLGNWMKENKYKPLLDYNAGLDSQKRSEVIDRFRDDGHRVMIASTKAAGEGLNLQHCQDAIILERQWNPADEEQAEKRFHRIGQDKPVTITYMIASETIDEYFTELVEEKRAIVANTLDGKQIDWNETGMLKELATILTTKGVKKWSL